MKYARGIIFGYFIFLSNPIYASQDIQIDAHLIREKARRELMDIDLYENPVHKSRVYEDMGRYHLMRLPHAIKTNEDWMFEYRCFSSAGQLLLHLGNSRIDQRYKTIQKIPMDVLEIQKLYTTFNDAETLLTEALEVVLMWYETEKISYYSPGSNPMRVFFRLFKEKKINQAQARLEALFFEIQHAKVFAEKLGSLLD